MIVILASVVAGSFPASKLRLPSMFLLAITIAVGTYRVIL